MITATFTLSTGSFITKKTHLCNLKHVSRGDIDEITLESLAFESGPTQYHQQQQQVLDPLLPTETTNNINPTIPKTNNIITTNIPTTNQCTDAEIIENAARAAILEIQNRANINTNFQQVVLPSTPNDTQSPSTTHETPNPFGETTVVVNDVR